MATRDPGNKNREHIFPPFFDNSMFCLFHPRKRRKLNLVRELTFVDIPDDVIREILMYWFRVWFGSMNPNRWLWPLYVSTEKLCRGMATFDKGISDKELLAETLWQDGMYVQARGCVHKAFVLHSSAECRRRLFGRFGHDVLRRFFPLFGSVWFTGNDFYQNRKNPETHKELPYVPRVIGAQHDQYGHSVHQSYLRSMRDRTFSCHEVILENSTVHEVELAAPALAQLNVDYVSIGMRINDVNRMLIQQFRPRVLKLNLRYFINPNETVRASDGSIISKIPSSMKDMLSPMPTVTKLLLRGYYVNEMMVPHLPTFCPALRYLYVLQINCNTFRRLGIADLRHLRVLCVKNISKVKSSDLLGTTAEVVLLRSKTAVGFYPCSGACAHEMVIAFPLEAADYYAALCRFAYGDDAVETGLRHALVPSTYAGIVFPRPFLPVMA